jgi:hypothetical protein
MIVFFVLLVLGIFFLISNLSDAHPGPNLFSEKDLLPLNNGPGNGYLRYWTLWLPEGEDPGAESVIRPLLFYFTNPDSTDTAKIKEALLLIKKLMFAEHLKIPNPLEFEPGNHHMLCEYVLSHKKDIREFRKQFSYLLDRYRLMINSEFFQDLTPRRVVPLTPFPWNWLHVNTMFVASAVLTALEGDWESGISDILATINFGLKYLETSRTVSTYVLARATLHISLLSVYTLMNRQCPDFVFKKVLQNMPPLHKEEILSKNMLIGEYLNEMDMIYKGPPSQDLISIKQNDTNKSFYSGLFFQPRRTAGYFHEIFSIYLQYLQTPPFKWKSSPVAITRKLISSKTSGLFWWWRNLTGKKVFTIFGKENSYLVESLRDLYAFRCFYEMTRLAAIIHLGNRSKLPIDQVLNHKEFINSIDPFSGNPYIWNSEGEFLYSVGGNGKDDKGSEYSDDLVVFCRLN